MKRIGFIGLGKMGLPLAVTMVMRGHSVMGYDVDSDCMNKEPKSYLETGPVGRGRFNDYLADSSIQFGSLQQVVDHGELIFVAVQTPHDPRYEGVTPLPEERVDFDYAFLKEAVQNVVEVAQHPIFLIIMSTVLPGTLQREIVPIVRKNRNVTLVYNPSFIAMGTTMRDFLNPEFVLIGTEADTAVRTMGEFYSTICSSPVRFMSIESAELTKVAYNTYISLKIAFTNTVMEICERFPNADCDDVTNALKGAHRRLVSSAYMSGGMGDGGGCHPRDNIALSWLARTMKLSFDLFEAAMKCREEQARWLAEMLCQEAWHRKLPIVILGIAFKPETNLTVGSPAYLVGSILREKMYKYTYVDDSVVTTPTEGEVLRSPAVFLIGCRHKRYSDFKFPKGSVVIDPHRYIRKQSDDVVVRRLGRGQNVDR